MAQKTTKVVVKRKKFIEAEIPLINTKIELIGNSLEEIKDKTIKLDLTRQLKGKSVEALVKIKIENDKAVAYPIKIKLMPYFIRRMIRKRISYVEDSFETPSQESMLRIKPFLITRKKVSKAVRKTLRNKTKNWIEDYLAGKKDTELFSEILSNRLQKPLSLMLKKTYPLSLCEIKVLEVIRPLKPEEVPKETKKKPEIEKAKKQVEKTQIEEIEKAEKEIKETQKKAAKVEPKKETKKKVEPKTKKKTEKKEEKKEKEDTE